jgi:two-component system, chemotaxis family, sensor kinase CheA
VDTDALKKSLIVKFSELTHDRLEAMQLAVLELEKENAAAAGERIARELHTVKGESRMLGLVVLGNITHALEDVLRHWQEGKKPAAHTADLILRGIDVVKQLLDDIPGAKQGTPQSERLLIELGGAPLPVAKPSVPKASSPAVGTGRPLAARVKPKTDPATPAAEPSMPTAVTPELVEQKKGTPAIRVRVETLDALGDLSGDLLVDIKKSELRNKKLHLLFDRVARVGDRLVRILDEVGAEHAQHAHFQDVERDIHSIRDDAFRFMREHEDGTDSLNGTLTQLASQVSNARTIPLSTVFEVFALAVREMAAVQRKQVELRIEQTQAGVDKSMVDDVKDAMIHLIRNAVDHGIEYPELRQTLGKSPQGLISIRARADGDLLSIQIEDDGRGLDPVAIKDVAIRKRVITGTQAAMLSDKEVQELIFRAGFSTRDEVGDTSGRGVGMDVVKRKVEGLGGAVSVSTRIGRGTTFSLRLPQSLALMRVLLVRLGEDIYGIPVADVEAVARAKPEERIEVFGTLAILHRGLPVTLTALGSLLGLNGGPRFERPPLVIVKHGDSRVALAVDGFEGEREVAVKPVGGDFLKNGSVVSGAAVLEDGRLAVLLHVPEVMAEVRRLVRPIAENVATKRLKVLLVDDSPIARATEMALVRALGHSVVEAQDGEEAWKLVSEQRELFDLILTDVQMPRLDGFALTRRLKQSAQSTIPVVILSSLASPEDRRRGADAGADAYLVKGELGVEALALTIERLTS